MATAERITRANTTKNLHRLKMPLGVDLTMIEWRQCVQFPNYQVSEYGHLRRMTPACGATVGKVLSPKLHKFGYPRYDARDNGGWVGTEAHKLVAVAFIGERPPGCEVAHEDGDPTNCHFSNLRWKTHRENEEDKLRHGTVPRGERNGGASTTESMVREVRARHAAGERQSEIARTTGLTFQNVSRIVNRQRWKHVDG